MPITNGTYQCNICDKPFQASSDDFYSCPCGESTIKPSDTHYTGYTYKEGTSAQPIEGETYYLPEEFITLSEKAQAIYDEIKRIQAETGYRYFLHEQHYRGKNDEKFLSGIHISVDECQSLYSSGTNTLKLSLNLHQSRYSTASTRIEERLEQFLNLMKQIEGKTLDLSKVGKLRQLAEELDMEEHSEQVHEYNYTFYL